MQTFLKFLAKTIALAAVFLLTAATTALFYMTAMPGSSHRAPLPPLTAEERDLATRLKRHVTTIASEEHNVAHFAKLEQAAQYIEDTLTAYGYKVKRQSYDVNAGSVRNLEVSIVNAPSGKAKNIIVVGAHYDSAQGAPGANDNGTGTAGVIELARMLKDLKPAEGYELKLVLYVNEEPPYFKTTQMGSWVHASDLQAGGQNVVAMLSLETMGYYSDAKGSQRYPFPFNLLYPDTGNFIGFVGTIESRALVQRTIASFRKHASFPSEGVAAPAVIPGIDWSDHWSYREFGYPALMITDTAPFRYLHYHTEADTVDKIDFERLARVVKGLEKVVREFAQAQ